jgi:putative holliday junction resolvase
MEMVGGRGRRVAFDYGAARIGLALSDLEGILASPWPFLANDESLKVHLIELFAEQQPIYCVLGFPRHLSGEPGSTRNEVEHFATLIQEISGVPVFLIDERLTTRQASEHLRQMGKNARDQKNLIDSQSAALILESALANERNGREPGERWR